MGVEVLQHHLKQESGKATVNEAWLQHCIQDTCWDGAVIIPAQVLRYLGQSHKMRGHNLRLAWERFSLDIRRNFFKDSIV